MDISNYSAKLPAVTDVYTDLSGLQQLKAEGDKDAAIKKIAQQFESLFINMMMKNMRSANAVFEEDSLFNSKDSQLFRDMYDNQLSLTISHGKGIGIADAFYQQMTRSHEQVKGVQGTGNIGKTLDARFENMALEKKDSLKESLISPSSTVDGKSANKPTKVAVADSPIEYIEKLIPYAKKAAEKLGVDKFMLIAQSALETGWGKYVLSDEKGGPSLNLFNIKSQGASKEASVVHDTLEFKQGVMQKEKAHFKVYDSFAESFSDFVDFIQTNARYKDAQNIQAESGLQSGSEAFIRAIHKAGYATDPDYSDKVLRVYDQVKSLVKDYIDQQSSGEI